MTPDGDTDVAITKVRHPLTEPAPIRQWSSPVLTDALMDARPGGRFRHDWPEFFFSGPILEADPPLRMVPIEPFNGNTSQGSTATTTLSPDGSGTRLTVIMRYRDAAARATAIDQGSTDGIADVYGRIKTLTSPA